MSSHFSPKSLMFYGTMIGSVVVLFRVVSGYGEAHLIAPPNIAGRYVSKQAIAGCPGSTRFALTIQQSGIYLHGALHPVETIQEVASPSPAAPGSQPANEALMLRGMFDQQQVSFTGTTRLPATCQMLNHTPANPNAELTRVPITIQGTVSQTEDTLLTGELRLEGANPFRFTAIRAVEPTAPSEVH